MLLKKVLQAEKQYIRVFLSEHKHLLWISALLIIFTYGIKLFWFDYSIDTEVAINDYQGLLHSWVSINRFGIILFKKIFFPDFFNPFLANLLTYATLFLVAIAISYLFYRILQPKKIKKETFVILVGLFATCPILAEMFNFNILSFEVCLASLAIVFAAYLLFLALQVQSKKIQLIIITLSILATTFAFSIYQALPSFYLACIFAVLVCVSEWYKQEAKQISMKSVFWKYVGWAVIVFAVSMALYEALPYVYAFLYSTNESLAGGYLTSKINWGKLPFGEIVTIIGGAIYKTLFGRGYFYSFAYLVGFIAMGATVTLGYIRAASKHKKDAWLTILAFIGLALTPFALIILMGNDGDIRTKMPTLELVVAFMFFYAYINTRKRFLRVGILLIAAIFIGMQMLKTNNLFMVEHMKYQEDVALSNQIIDRINTLDVESYDNYQLVVLGSRSSQLPNMIVTEGVLGKSFFQWDAPSSVGVSYRVGGFMNTQGYRFKLLRVGNKEDAKTYKKWSTSETTKALKPWPAVGSVLVDEASKTVVLKLSN